MELAGEELETAATYILHTMTISHNDHLEVGLPISRLLSGLSGMWSSMKITLGQNKCCPNLLKCNMKYGTNQQSSLVNSPFSHPSSILCSNTNTHIWAKSVSLLEL